MLKKLVILIGIFSLAPLASWAGKQIIILDIQGGNSNMMTVNYLFWLTTSQPIAKPNLQSRWAGASGGEVSSLQAGSVIEESYQITVASATSTAALKTLLNAQFTARQTYFTSQLNPGAWYGIFFDSTTLWSQ